MQTTSWLRNRPLAILGLLVISCSAYATGQPQAEPSGGQTFLRVNVNALLIPVVVRDAHEQIVPDLTQGDFQVFDNGKRRKVTGFSVVRSTQRVVNSLPSATDSTPPSSAGSRPSSPRSLVLLFDDRHFSPGGLMEVKKIAPQILDSVLGPGDRAVVLSFNGANSGFTADRKVLAETIEKIKSHPSNLNHRGQCPDISYYAADQILNKHSDTQYQIELERAENCSLRSSATDPGYLEILVREAANQSLLSGDQDALISLSYLRDVASSMSRLPGQRTLVLISPGFLNFSERAMQVESQILNAAAKSDITINALDMRGLVSDVMTANESGEGSIFAKITGQTQSNFGESALENENALAELANGSGGYFLRGGNDLSQQLTRVAGAPDVVYLLEVSLNGVKENGKYHKLKIKVNRKGLKIQARRGYYAPEQDKHKK